MKFLSLLLLIWFKLSSAQTKVNIQLFNGFTDTAIKAKLDSAVDIVEMLVNSKLFEEKVLRSKYLRKKNKSNQEILNLFKSGKKESSVSDNVIINLKVDVYDNSKNEIGNTDNDNVIHTNKQYILENGASCYAAHLIHEYCHVLGFRHAKWRLPFRSKTVPYKIGDFATEILKANCP